MTWLQRYRVNSLLRISTRFPPMIGMVAARVLRPLLQWADPRERARHGSAGAPSQLQSTASRPSNSTVARCAASYSAAIVSISSAAGGMASTADTV